MKKLLSILLLALCIVACNNEYDDSAVWDSIKALEQKTQAMESVLNALKRVPMGAAADYSIENLMPYNPPVF